MDTTILIVILNLIIIESLLSVDNAAVLAIMVKDLPDRQRHKALRYGLLGAYFFRGLCLLLASVLIKVMWLKIVGGLYLLYLVYGHFSPKVDTIEEEKDVKERGIYKWALRIGMSRFWATVLMVEIMDLAFSMDNVFAAVALSPIFWVVMVGVGIGILAMRFVAGWFVVMITKYPSLETSAFVVIGLLGLKLIVSGLFDYIPAMNGIRKIMESHWFDMYFSLGMMLIFFLPLLNRRRKFPAI